MNQPTAQPMTNDGLDWLREIRRDLFQQCGQDLNRLGDRYRQVQATEQDKVIAPRKALADAVCGKGAIQM